MNSDSGVSILSAGIIPLIVVLGLIIAVLLVWNGLSLTAHYKEINAVMNWKNTTSVLNRSTLEMEDQSKEETVTPDTIRQLQTRFNHSCSFHEVLSQLIPLFPLLGILGTVSGLIGQLNNTGVDTSVLLDSLKTALNSTYWGLIFAIVLKFLDSVWPSRKISETDIILEDYEKKLNNAVMLGNISE
ncbi:MAG: MotA/TolQ/ExbB proton channel family protein [Lachnospiraceae bacterium]|nr:MotA/TolQ/ExbB proton channel family protein [Lachnospiraceae bacterium]